VTADAEYVLEGLEGPAEILVDRWGVPHMYASTLYDVFRVQGFNAARDRLWQLDFWRRRGLGLLAEVFGPSMVERDRASRLFYYRGDMQPEWLSYGSDTKRVATAFVEGVNAFIRLALQDRELLPLEFRQLGYEPALWAAEDFARIRSNGLYYNLDSEVARALILRDHDPRVEELRRRREPPVGLVVPEGLDLSVIPHDVQRVYRLAIDPPDLSQAREAVLQGSNNWVLAAERTTTGRPLLANDPHRALSVPSLRYLAHLSAPGLDVIGAGEPALPGISIGHNGRIAFGLTIFAIDQEDLYVYATNPDEPLEYRYQGRWEPMRVVHDTVKVKGGDDVEVELRYTRHGPVIYEDVERHTAFAVRAAWLEPGMAPYLGSMDYMRATNWDEFLAAMNRWGAPPENQLFADPSGHIGWKAAGLTPIRPNWDGTLPVPGDGRYEWAGFRDMDELPVATNPERGWLATANEMNLPDDYPAYDKVISFDWYASSRAERLAEVFAGDRRFSPEDCLRLQSDAVSLPARRILQRLAQVQADDPTTTAARRPRSGRCPPTPADPLPSPAGPGDWRWWVGTRRRRVLPGWQAPQPCRPGLGPRWSGRLDLRWSLRALAAYPSPARRRITAGHAPLRGSGALRAIDASARLRSWRTFGPRGLRRQSEPAWLSRRVVQHERRAAGRCPPNKVSARGRPCGADAYR
jgi:penicillin amidase